MMSRFIKYQVACFVFLSVLSSTADVFQILDATFIFVASDHPK